MEWEWRIKAHAKFLRVTLTELADVAGMSRQVVSVQGQVDLTIPNVLRVLRGFRALERQYQTHTETCLDDLVTIDPDTRHLPQPRFPSLPSGAVVWPALPTVWINMRGLRHHLGGGGRLATFGDLHERSGITTHLLGAIESGKRVPRWGTIMRLYAVGAEIAPGLRLSQIVSGVPSGVWELPEVDAEESDDQAD